MVARTHRLISSGRLPNARPAECASSGQEQRSLEKVQRYLDAPVEEDVLAKGDSKAHRQWLMRIWNR